MEDHGGVFVLLAICLFVFLWSRRKQAEGNQRKPEQAEPEQAEPKRRRRKQTGAGETGGSGPDTRAYDSLFLSSLSFLER